LCGGCCHGILIRVSVLILAIFEARESDVFKITVGLAQKYVFIFCDLRLAKAMFSK